MFISSTIQDHKVNGDLSIITAGAGSERSGGHSYGAVGVAADCLADWPQRHLHDLARGLTP